MIRSIKQYWKPLALISLVLIIACAVLMYGNKRYKEGVMDEQARMVAQAISAAQSRAKTDHDISRMPDGAAIDELRQHWSRD